MVDELMRMPMSEAEAKLLVSPKQVLGLGTGYRKVKKFIDEYRPSVRREHNQNRKQNKPSNASYMSSGH